MDPKVADGLPKNRPGGREQFPRLQLRGSAGFAPASLSSPSGKDARSENIYKEPIQRPTTVKGAGTGSQSSGGGQTEKRCQIIVSISR